jgi:phosphatidylglycerophosphatase A
MERLSTIAASMFGIGYIPYAPGTVASAVAVPLAMLLGAHHGGGIAILAAALAAFVAGVIACEGHVRATGREDPSECVIDELAGQWLACAFALFSFGGLLPVAQTPWLPFLLAFLLFRLFDITKPWPVSWADRSIAGGLGVMADDMLAGLMAGLVLALVRVLVPL